MAEPVWCCGVMVEAANPQRLHPTSILDVYKVFEHLEMLWMGMLYIPNTWGNTQHMTVKPMPGGVWCWQYKGGTCTKVLIMDIMTYLVKLYQSKGTKITSRYASRAQHLIPFQNSQGIITDMVVSSRGRLLGREPSLTTPFHKYSDFDRFFYGLRAELTLSRQPQYIKNASHWDMPKNCALVMWNLEDLCDINFNVPL